TRVLRHRWFGGEFRARPACLRSGHAGTTDLHDLFQKPYDEENASGCHIRSERKSHLGERQPDTFLRETGSHHTPSIPDLSPRSRATCAVAIRPKINWFSKKPTRPLPPMFSRPSQKSI